MDLHQIDHGERWITRDGSRPKYIAAGYGPRPDLGGWQEMDHGRRMTINLLLYMKIFSLCKVIPFSRSLTSTSSYEVTIKRRYADIRFTDSIGPLTECPSSNAKYDPESDPESHNYNADPAHLEAVWHKSSLKQRYLRGGWHCRNRNTLYREQLLYLKCRKEEPWIAFTNREG